MLKKAIMALFVICCNSSNMHSQNCLKELFDAIWNDNIELVEKLVKENPKEINSRFSEAKNSTPLIYSIMRGNVDITKFLIDRGADVNICEGDSGNSPLHIAALRGNLNIVKLLVAKGANLNAINNNGQTALMSIAVLQKSKAHQEIIDYFIEIPVNLNIKDKNGKSFFYYYNLIEAFLNLGKKL